MRNYYRTKKVFKGGKKIGDSKAEVKRMFGLELLEKKGEIKNLQKQVEFELQPSFKRKVWKDGKFKEITIRSIKYTPDFTYIDPKLGLVAEESKGFATDIYKLRAKLFQFKYPQYYFLQTK